MKKLLEMEFLGAYYVTLAWKFWNYGQNKASPLEVLQSCVAPIWKIQKQKPRPIEQVPHDFLFIAHGISTPFLITPWNSAWYPAF